MVMVYEVVQHKADASLTTTPDLIMIDGGKGQLSTVMEVVSEFQLPVRVISLAKREEEVFLPGQEAPIAFPPDSPAKFLLMRLRDEAHRSANHHREGRIKKVSTLSALDAIPGIGPATRTQLLQKFGSVMAVRTAGDEALREILSEEQLKSLRAVL